MEVVVMIVMAKMAVSDIEEGYDIMAVVAMKTTAIAELHLII